MATLEEAFIFVRLDRRAPTRGKCCRGQRKGAVRRPPPSRLLCCDQVTSAATQAVGARPPLAEYLNVFRSPWALVTLMHQWVESTKFCTPSTTLLLTLPRSTGP